MSGRGTKLAQVGAGSLVAALSSYLLNVLSAWALPLPENTILLTLLAILYVYYGILSAVTTEFTRTVSAAETSASQGGPAAWRVALVIAGLVAIVVAVTSPVWRIVTSFSMPFALVVAMVIGLAGYSFHCTSCGVLAGSGRWSTMSLLVATEGFGRIALGVVVTVLAASATGYVLAVVVASFAWAVFLVFSRTTRDALKLTTDRPLRALLPRFGAAFVAQGSSVVLTVGFPALLAVTTPALEYATSAPLLLAISLTRAPLLIPLAAYQSVIVRTVATRQSASSRTLGLVILGCVGIGALGGVAAYFVGPELMVLMFSAAYRVDGLVLAGLVLAAASVALVTITGAIAQALAHHVAFLSGWVVAVVATFAVLLLPASLDARAIWSLAAGPIVGAIVHLVALVRGEKTALTEIPA